MIFLQNFTFLEQVGKGLSKDAKAQKLAFQHWIEAVITFSPYCNVGTIFCWIICIFVKFEPCFHTFTCRLIRGIDTATACIIIMKSGVKMMLVSRSFTGTQFSSFLIC